MIPPHARYAFDWPEAGGKFYNVYDPTNSVYQHGSTLREYQIDRMGLPKVETDEDKDNLIRLTNALYLYRKEPVQ